jgi:hypothetical protein
MSETISKSAELKQDLREDIETAWLPDPLAWADLAHVARQAVEVPANESTSFLRVPRPRSSPMHVYVLPLVLHLELHRAVDPLRSPSEQLLLPGVCGYRRGAQSDTPYQAEHRRFQELSQALVETSSVLATADVADFFRSVDWHVLLQMLEQYFPQFSNGIAATPKRLAAASIQGLPAGYGDARLLANVLLHQVDLQLDVPFVRWVDDYRLFAADSLAARAALRRMGSALLSLGLRLNSDKVKIYEGRDARTRVAQRPLESVFHPGEESPSLTRNSLRGVFLDAAADPINQRRELRFAIRRLGECSDPIAIDFAFWSLRHAPWEAPRMVAYLAKFLEIRSVAERTIEAFTDALARQDEWLIGRIIPLVASQRLEEPTLSRVSTMIANVKVPVLWGLGLRLLGLQGNKRAVVDELQQARVLHPRAAIAAYRDLEIDPPESLAMAAPGTFRRASEGSFPPPSARSIL